MTRREQAQPIPAGTAVEGIVTEISFQDIRERAYELWERHHRPDGFEVELWIMAERELRAERERAAGGKPDPLQPPNPDTVPPAPGDSR